MGRCRLNIASAASVNVDHVKQTKRHVRNTLTTAEAVNINLMTSFDVVAKSSGILL
jgi:hypothetical protein